MKLWNSGKTETKIVKKIWKWIEWIQYLDVQWVAVRQKLGMVLE